MHIKEKRRLLNTYTVENWPGLKWVRMASLVLYIYRGAESSVSLWTSG